MSTKGPAVQISTSPESPEGVSYAKWTQQSHNEELTNAISSEQHICPQLSQWRDTHFGKFQL